LRRSFSQKAELQTIEDVCRSVDSHPRSSCVSIEANLEWHNVGPATSIMQCRHDEYDGIWIDEHKFKWDGIPLSAHDPGSEPNVRNVDYVVGQALEVLHGSKSKGAQIDFFTGQPLAVLRTGGSWSKCTVQFVDDNVVGVNLESGGKKAVPIDKIHRYFRMQEDIFPASKRMLLAQGDNLH